MRAAQNAAARSRRVCTCCSGAITGAGDALSLWTDAAQPVPTRATNPVAITARPRVMRASTHAAHDTYRRPTACTARGPPLAPRRGFARLDRPEAAATWTWRHVAGFAVLT